MSATKDVQPRPIIPRWEPHEAHQFTKPYSRRSSKPEFLEDLPDMPSFPFNQPVKRRRAAKKRGK